MGLPRLVPKLDDVVVAAVGRGEKKLDRIIELLELLAVTSMWEQGIPPDEIAALVTDPKRARRG